MRLSYVTVCVDYLDLLKVAHHHNLAQFDDYIVVTHPRDTETVAWTQAHKEVTPVYTDAFYRNGARFNKGLALSEGLNALRATLAEQGATPEWVALMDADTFVPPDWREQLKRANLDREWMYGARRVLLPTWADYERLWTDDLDSFACPMGHSFGWLQLFHWESAAFQSRLATGEPYPQGNDCTEVDWRFRDAWGGWEVPYTVPRGKLAELPFRVFNLGKDGENHFGRVSAPFVPPS
jgi:hypothetical protein